MKIYFDACCLSRLTDNQSQARIRAEAEAVERILEWARNGAVDWISSVALEAEIEGNPDAESRREIEALLLLANEVRPLDADIVERAKELETAGYGAFDALHLSFAEAGSADVLLTTDDRFERQAARGLGSPRIRVKNPVLWWKERIQ
jgi:predicted nucleic acid-binding protein